MACIESASGGGVRAMVSSYIAWYLFLAGAGGGAFAIAATVDFALRFRTGAWLERASRVTDAGLVAGPALVALGAVFLTLDLGAPEQAFQLFLAPSGSLLSVGAWSIALFCLTAAGALATDMMGEGAFVRVAETALSIVAALLSVFVMVYAGVFLSIYPSVPFLHTPLVPLLFVASALATGAAALIAIAFFRLARDGVAEGMGSLVVLDAPLVLVEAAAIAVFVATSWLAGGPAAQSASSLVSGSGAMLFWLGVVAAGLVVPLSVDAVCARRPHPAALMVGAAATLAGGLCLRFALLVAAERFCLVDMSVLVYWM